jgi:homoserine dehydrogenase
MKRYNFCLLGFGNVGHNMVKLLHEKSDVLRDEYGVDWRITGVATRRMGWLAHPDGLDAEALAAGEPVGVVEPIPTNVREWLAVAQADVLFEITSLDFKTGQPAIDHIRAALEAGAHAITANKGTVVHAYHELSELAQSKGKQFLFESTVVDGLPVFSLFRDTLPVVNLLRFSGLLNATTSVILSEIEQGRGMDEAIKQAQELGITETNPSADIDGWDAAVKVVALATVLMNRPIKLDDVQRAGISSLTAEQIQAAWRDGRPYRLVSRIELMNDEIIATVRPEQVSADSPLISNSPEALILHFEMDTISHLTLIEDKAGPYSTAYGLLSDFIYAMKAEGKDNA